ncbi:MAG: hypothetical protein ACYCW6_28885, partial [Candidatus Xenobia bacterium]
WEIAWDEHCQHRARARPLFTLAVLLLAAGHVDPSRQIAIGLEGAGVDALALTCMLAVTEPEEQAITRLRNALPAKREMPRVQAAAWQILADCLQQQGHLREALEAADHAVARDPGAAVWRRRRRELAALADDGVEACRQHMERLSKALERWRRLNRSGFPGSLEALIPSLWGSVAACPRSRIPYLYRTNATRNRSLIACRHTHHLRRDSTLGFLATPPLKPQPAEPEPPARRLDVEAAVFLLPGYMPLVSTRTRWS